MTQEEKELLLKDLSARLPYGIKLQVRLDYGDNSHKEGIYDADIDAITSYNIEVTYYDANMGGKARDWTFMYEEVKPYLRPMSSMTEEEKKEYHNLCYEEEREEFEFGEWVTRVYYHNTIESIDWLNAHHFDFRGLILKGLAIEAPEGMYN
jgi:hypothetical protein